MRNRHSVTRLASIAAAAAALSLALLAPAAPAKPPTIFINGDSPANYKFTPRVLEVKRGATVNWSWDSNGPHDVTFPKIGKSSVTGASETYKLRFKKRGTFKYLCSVHGFRGKIVAG